MCSTLFALSLQLQRLSRGQQPPLAISGAGAASRLTGRTNADHSRTKTMTLDAVEFIRRFLLHILPAGMVRIGQFGSLANRVRQSKLELCSALLALPLRATLTA